MFTKAKRFFLSINSLILNQTVYLLDFYATKHFLSKIHRNYLFNAEFVQVFVKKKKKIPYHNKKKNHFLGNFTTKFNRIFLFIHIFRRMEIDDFGNTIICRINYS